MENRCEKSGHKWEWINVWSHPMRRCVQCGKLESVRIGVRPITWTTEITQREMETGK